MKNLKKVLALVLVMAVVFGFTAMTSSAAFTDEAEIARKEAVEVMAAIGVINGYTDGTFKPKGEVTRAEMAKMITVLLNKGDDVGDLYKGAVTFADSASHWAAGYIAYCAQEKIINGRNASTFDPNANVTGTEAAKMLLCAIGYDPAAEGLTGANWAANTLSLAKKCELKASTNGGIAPEVEHDNTFNLLQEMDNVSMNAPLSREDAAQMILNAMLCTLVEYSGNAQTITIGNTSFTTNAELKSTATSLYKDYFKLTGGKKLERGGEAGDDFGRPARVWKRGGETIGSYSKIPVVSYKDAFTGGRLYTDLGKLTMNALVKDGEGNYVNIADTTNNRYAVISYVDGVVATGEAAKPIAKRIASGNNDNIAENGSWTEVYIDDVACTVTIVTAYYYVGQIQNNYAAVVDASGDITKEAYVTLKSIDTTTSIPTSVLDLKDGSQTANKAFITDAFTAADRNVTNVVFTKAADKIQSLAKAEIKTGVAGAVTKGIVGGKVQSFNLDSTTYYVADKADSTELGKAKFGYNATLYLDPNGNVIFGEVTTSDQIVYVLTAGQAKDAVYGDTITTGANLLFPDGKSEKVNVYNENGSRYVDGDKNPIEGTLTALAGKVCSYTVNSSGEYDLTPLEASRYATGITSVKANTPTLAGSTMYANDNTVFVVETVSTDTTGAKTYSYTTYTGLKNVPTVEEANTESSYAFNIVAVNTPSNPSSASFVFVIGGKTADSVRASVSVFMQNTSVDGAATDANNNTYYTTKAVVDGEIKTVQMTQSAYNTVANNAVKGKPKAYINLATDANGYVNSMKAPDMLVAGQDEANKKVYVREFSGFFVDDVNGTDGLYRNGIITMANSLYGNGDVYMTRESFSVNANTPVYVFDNKANTVTSTTIDAFSTSLKYQKVIIVLDSSEKILNGNDIVTAVYVAISE